MTRTRTTLIVAAGLVIASGSLLLFRAKNGPDYAFQRRATAPNELGCRGSPTTLSGAADSVPFPLELPDSELANPGNISQVLMCASDQVEVDFSSGVILTLGTNPFADPAAEWVGLAETYPEFSTGTVRGVPASLADPAKGALGGVDLVENGVRITITGNGAIPLTDLVKVTESIGPIPSPTPSPSAA